MGGRLWARGLSEELNDRHYLIVDGLDGQTHYVDIGRGDATEQIPEGAVVALRPKPVGPRKVDRTVAKIAAANGWRYDADIHLRHDPTATAEFAETHVRRLEVMRRMGDIVEREPDGIWIIAADHPEPPAPSGPTRAPPDPSVLQHPPPSPP